VLSSPSFPPPPAPVRSYRGQTWGAVGAGVLCLVLAVVCLVTVLQRTTAVPLDVTVPTPASASQLRTGHCLKALPPDGTVGSVVVVPCSTGHRAEVIAQVWLGDEPDDARPSSTSMASTVESACAQVPVVHVPADARYVAWLPSDGSWDAGDRRALCLVTAATLVGSARG